MNTKPSASRRNVVLNIETVTTNPSDPRGTVSVYARRVICISMLVDDGISIIEHSFVSLDEERLLRQFWERVNPGDLFIGQNSQEFDLSLVRQRSWIVGIKPSSDIDLRRFYSHDLTDIMHMWSKWGATLRPSLEGLDNVLSLQGKTARGSKVAEWWALGDLDSIAEYCREDVRLAFQVFLKLTFQALPDRYNLQYQSDVRDQRADGDQPVRQDHPHRHEVRAAGRSTWGVKLLDLEPQDKVAAVVIPPEEAKTQPEE